MDFGERFQSFTIHTVICRAGVPATSEIFIGFMKISQVTLVMAGGGPGSRTPLASYALDCTLAV